jgi:GntR family transcriptional regulator
MLGTTVGAAILIGEEIAYTAEATPVLIGVNRYRGDAYRFQADLFRRG